MSPERTASQLGQFIVALSKNGGKLPAPWTPANFIELVGKYQALVSTIQGEGKPTTGGEPDQQDLDDTFQHGRMGAYRDMEARARALDAAARKGRKTSKQS